MSDPHLEDIRAALNAAFPDSRSTASDDHVAQVRALIEDLKGAQREAKRPLGERGEETGLYVASANHKRLKAPHSEFEQDLVMARIDLPAEEADWEFETRAGFVSAHDHKLPSVAHVRRDWEEWLKPRVGVGGSLDRVELLTPCRLGGTRFSAIATYVGYFSDAPERPSFVLLEAGLATGEAATLYWSVEWTDDPVTGIRRAIVPPQQSGYSPTPFSSVRDYYGGHVDFDLTHPGEIRAMHVDALDRDKKKYIEVDVDYRREDDPALLWPALITAAAGLRVGAISLALGRTDTLEATLGLLGHALEWKQRP